MAKEQAEHDSQIKLWNIPAHPYMIVCGELDSPTEFLVSIGDLNYSCDNLLQAVDLCYGSLKALRSFPPLLDHVWIFLETLVYRIKSSKDYTNVDVAITAISSELGIPETYYLDAKEKKGNS